MDMQRHFARAGAEHEARSLDEITQVEHLVEEVDPLLSKIVHPEEQLDTPVAIFDMSKGDLAHGARGTDTTCQRDLHLCGRLAFRCSLLGGFEGRNGLEAGMRPLGPGREWLNPFLDKFIDFLKTDFF